MSETVHFTIEGEFITNHFRNLFLEGDWQSALTGLQESLVSQDEEGNVIHYPHDDAVKILMGEEKFVGENNSISLEKDYKEIEIKSQLDFMYKGLIYVNHRWYLPYAFVNTVKQNEECAQERAMIYSSYTDRDIVIFAYVNNQKHAILCQETHKSIPSWLFREYSLMDKQDKINFLSEKGLLEERGFEEYQDFDEILDYQSIDSEEYYVEIEEDFRYEYKRDINFKNIQKEVVEQAKTNGGFFSIKLTDNREYLVPKAPFFNWALKDLGDRLATFKRMDWNIISAQGMKMQGDNPEHTDWVVGMGIKFEDFYKDEILQTHMSNLAFKVYQLHDKQAKFIRLSGDGHFTGKIKFISSPDEDINLDEIPVIPNASIKYFEFAKKMKDRCIITLVGGPAAHLCVNAKEIGINLILMPETELKNGDYIYVDLFKGECNVY